MLKVSITRASKNAGTARTFREGFGVGVMLKVSITDGSDIDLRAGDCKSVLGQPVVVGG
jgi:hypothetical protein